MTVSDQRAQVTDLITLPPSEFAATREQLRKRNPLALASAAGALTLLEENWQSQWLLGAFASLVAELPGTNSKGTDSAELESLLTSGPLAKHAGHLEDPQEDVITEEITSYAGSCLVGSGLSVDAVDVLRLYLHAFVLNAAVPAELSAELRNLTTAALRLSDDVLRKAGLERNMSPREGRKIMVPSENDLAPLQQAVTYSDDELKVLLTPLDPAVLAPIVTRGGRTPLSDQAMVEGLDHRFPLLKIDDFVIVLRPFDLALALRHHMTLRAVAAVGAEQARAWLADAVVQDVRESLRRMGLRPDVVSAADGVPYRELRARCDRDKVVSVLVLSDDYGGISESDPYTVWDAGEALEAAQKSFVEIGEELAENRDDQVAVLVCETAGREAAIGLDAESNSCFFSVSDLAAVAVLETGERLALWKFAQAVSALREVSMIRTTSTLATYAIYRNHDYSFREWGERDMITLLPGIGLEERRDAKRRRDRHGAIHPSGAVIEVEEASSDVAEQGSIFGLIQPFDGRLLLSVGTGPLGIWVKSPKEDIGPTFQIVQTVAYWLGQLGPHIEEAQVALRRAIPAIEFEVDPQPRELWLSGSGGEGGSPGEIKVSDTGALILTLGPGIRAAMVAKDNEADRQIVRFLIEGIELVAEALGVEVTLEKEALVDEVAPLGLKKHLLGLPIGDAMASEPIEGEPRLVQTADVSAARFALAEHLEKTFGFDPGVVPHDQRSKVLKSGVAALFERTRDFLDPVGDEDLLEELMLEQERLFASARHQMAILGVRLATYPDATKTLRDDISSANQAAVCCRFLIEYVAATPPEGDGRWSQARFDAAMASVAELIDWGNLDDAIHGDLTELDLVIRDNGQLALAEYDRYEAGRSAYFDAYVAEQRSGSEAQWRKGEAEKEEGGSDEASWHELDEPMRTEAGATLIELNDTLLAANIVARQRGLEVVRLPREEAIKAIAAAWDEPDEAVVAAAVEYLTMGPRGDFLSPPTGETKDTFPWLFARRWSYNRRPFIHHAESDEILWGRREVLQARHLLVAQVLSGRYQALAETEELRRALGGLADRTGREFEDRVISVFEDESFPVVPRVKTLGGDALQRKPGETLGDIDVLVGDNEAKCLWAIECKDLSGALTPAEIAREMAEHFREVGTTSVSKHVERVAWLGERIPAALSRLEIEDDAEKWTVRGLLVTGRNAASPFITDVPFDVVTAEKAVERVRKGPQKSPAGDDVQPAT